MHHWKVFARLSRVVIVLAAVATNSFAASVVGAWYSTNSGQAQSTVVAILFGDNRFVELEDGNPLADPSGQDGLEKGYYNWNSTTGAFSVNLVINTNGEWGFSSLPPGSTLTPSDNFLMLDTSEGTFTVDRVFDPTSAIVGAWYVSAGPNAQDLTVVTFLPNGRFMIGIDPPATGFIEFGSYTWNPLTGALNAMIDTSNAPPGLSVGLPSFTSAGIVNGNLVLSSTDSTLMLANVAAPEPQTFALLGVGLAGLLARRTMRRRVA